MTKLKKTLIIFAGILTQITIAQAFDLDLKVANQMAGESLNYNVATTVSEAKINLELTKPSGEKITFAGLSDQNGNLIGQIADYHTSAAGIYALKAYFPALEAKATVAKFEVLRADLDVQNSTIKTPDLIFIADGKDSARISVNLVDVYDNPIEGVQVKLISNRPEDQISSISEFTDKSGVAKFELKTVKSGNIDISAIVPENGEVLASRLTLNAMPTQTASFNLFTTALAAEVGPITGFELTDFPEIIKPNQNVSFKLKAVDAGKMTVKDYTGTVRFASDKAQIVLPLDYKFIATDLGEHQFNLGLSFKEAGTYKLQVIDTANKDLTGEKTIVVVADAAVTPTTGTATITSPLAGKSSAAVQTIAGAGKSGAAIKIYNNNDIIGDAVAGMEGKFSYKTPALPDGKNEIYFTVVDAITNQVVATSNKVVVEIDTKAPEIDEIKLTPATIKTGEKFEVGVFSEANLSQAGVVFNGDITILEPSIDDATFYSGQLAAPTTPGKYDVQILLADELGNEVTFDDKLSLQIDASGVKVENKAEKEGEKPEVPTPPVTTPDPETPVATSSVPSDVNGLLAYPSNNRVTLVWNAATDDKGVQNYKIYFGSDVKDLKNEVMTKTASTTWYIPNLENGKQYFFSVVAIDADGQESKNRSELVSSMPIKLEIDVAAPTKPETELDLDGLKPAAYNGPMPVKQPGTGPGLLLLIPAAIGGSFLIRRKK